jgi:hypothetical protein
MEIKSIAEITRILFMAIDSGPEIILLMAIQSLLEIIVSMAI